MVWTRNRSSPTVTTFNRPSSRCCTSLMRAVVPTAKGWAGPPTSLPDRMRATPKACEPSMHPRIMTLYRSSKMWRGRTISGKRTVLRGKRGIRGMGSALRAPKHSTGLDTPSRWAPPAPLRRLGHGHPHPGQAERGVVGGEEVRHGAPVVQEGDEGDARRHGGAEGGADAQLGRAVRQHDLVACTNAH